MNTVFELLNGMLDQLVPRAGSSVVTAKDQDKILTAIESLQLHFMKAHLAQDAGKIGKVAVRSSQAAGSYLLNSVYDQHLAEPAEVYLHIQNGLCGFIDGLHKNFPGQFDYSMPMPLPCWLKISATMEDRLVSLERAGVSTTLLNLIRAELHYACLHHTPDYIAGQYWQSLGMQLLELRAEQRAERRSDKDQLNNAVVNCLVGCNFNSGKFICYVLDAAAEELTEEDSPVVYWANMLKWMNRLPTSPEMQLYRNADSCKAQLIELFRNELFAAEQLHTDDVVQDKLITGLSVGQFALLIRLLVDTGVLKTRNTNQLIRLLSRLVKTTRTVEISAESLRQKYYQINAASVKMMREHLAEMMSKLKEY
ncbi:MAG: hypothetical protein JNK08_05645 [Sediminibacterium sp.]|nr:hypothetical protein [Sediminibacterium sp.]